MLDGVYPGIPGLLVLGHQVQLVHVGLRGEDQGEGSFSSDLSKPKRIKILFGNPTKLCLEPIVISLHT